MVMKFDFKHGITRQNFDGTASASRVQGMHKSGAELLVKSQAKACIIFTYIGSALVIDECNRFEVFAV